MITSNCYITWQVLQKVHNLAHSTNSTLQTEHNSQSVRERTLLGQENVSFWKWIKEKKCENWIWIMKKNRNCSTQKWQQNIHSPSKNFSKICVFWIRLFVILKMNYEKKKRILNLNYEKKIEIVVHKKGNKRSIPHQRIFPRYVYPESGQMTTGASILTRHDLNTTYFLNEWLLMLTFFLYIVKGFFNHIAH